MLEASHATADPPFQAGSSEPIAVLELDARLLQSEWIICDKVAEYLSGIASGAHGDAARFSNLFSVVVNELTELACKNASNKGAVRFELYRRAESIALSTVFTCAEEVSTILTHTLTEATDPDLVDEPLGDANASALRVLDFARICNAALHACVTDKGLMAIEASFPLRGELA